jgi:ATP adenylyltransferase
VKEAKIRNSKFKIRNSKSAIRNSKTTKPATRGIEKINAPWRHRLFDAGKDPECFICRAIAMDPARDRENLLLIRGTNAVVVLNRYPYTVGALMVAPKKHVGEIEKIGPEEWLEFLELARRGMAVLDRLIHPQGYNLGLNVGREAGAGLDEHLHLHIVPRWNADTNFITTIFEARVLAEEPEHMFDRLKPLLAEI